MTTNSTSAESYICINLSVSLGSNSLLITRLTGFTNGLGNVLQVDWKESAFKVDFQLPECYIFNLKRSVGKQ
jgi:hypothetical protein